MRNAFARVLTELAKHDESLLLFYADIGNRLFNPLKEFAEERTINAGIAEANMASMAAGSAMMGHKPFIYTITPFTTARNFEQIKIDIAYQNQPVIIVGTGSGLSYANLGPTHHSFEDIALMRALPNMHIVCPADAYELEQLMPQLLSLNAPCYFRIGKKNEPAVHEGKPTITYGKVHIMRPERTYCRTQHWYYYACCTETSERINRSWIITGTGEFHTIKPLDTDYLNDAMTRFEHVITLEEHNVSGGFGSAVLEYFSEQGDSSRVHRFGIPDRFIDQVHSTADARTKAGLTVEDMLTTLSKRGVV